MRALFEDFNVTCRIKSRGRRRAILVWRSNVSRQSIAKKSLRRCSNVFDRWTTRRARAIFILHSPSSKQIVAAAAIAILDDHRMHRFCERRTVDWRSSPLYLLFLRARVFAAAHTAAACRRICDENASSFLLFVSTPSHLKFGDRDTCRQPFR